MDAEHLRLGPSGATTESDSKTHGSLPSSAVDADPESLADRNMGNAKTKDEDCVDELPLQQPAHQHTTIRLDNMTNVELNAWVSRNIKKKECVCFIPQEASDGDICGCGYTRERHIPETLYHEVPPRTAWDPQKHVQEFPSDAHGDLIFTSSALTWAKYVRASCDTQPSVLYELMTKHWHLPVPGLLISVTGGNKNFHINNRLKNQFSCGLVRVAQSTGAWIITEGTHSGVRKHVGEAIRDFRGQQNSNIALIGIAPWGMIHNQQALLCDGGGAPALYPMDESFHGQLCCLDNNHTHFILVDNGMYGNHKGEIQLRTQLEKYISEQNMYMRDIKIPKVCVVLGGGHETLDTIHSSMRNNTPCFIMEGSSSMVDVIAQVAHLPRFSSITTNLIREKLRNIYPDSSSSFDNSKISQCTRKIEDILRKRSLLTIVREERDGDHGMGVDILQVALKASRKIVRNGEDNWDQLLQLAVSWNRSDIAETQIFPPHWTCEPSDLFPFLTLVLIENKPSFMCLFLERGVTLQEYLTRERLTHLYNNTDPSSLIHRKLERLATAQGSKEGTENRVELHHVSRLLKELLGGSTEPLYPDAKHQSLRDTKHIIQKDVCVLKSHGHLQKMEHPVRDLLIWCIVQSRAEMADIIWNLTHDCVTGALACNKILKVLAKEEERTETKEKMLALANLYEERALGVFSECYQSNNDKAQNLLIRASPKWGKTTALELAQDVQSLLFMSQEGVQMCLTKTWWGKLSVDNGFLHILLCMLFFPLIYSGLISYSSEPYSRFWKLKAFFNAPIVKFYYNVGSYIGFLWLFAYVLMIDFQPSPSWREYLLYVWVFSIFCEELRQLLYDPEQCGFVKKSIQYISEFWNQVDTMALGLFALGLICRLVSAETVYLGRIFLSLDFMIFCVGLMHIFTVSKVLGPKLIILHRMVKDIFFFLFLLAIWIVSYGVAKQSIQTTNEQRLDWIFHNVLYQPYLILFGQIPTDVESVSFGDNKCTQNGSDPDLPKCVYNDGAGNVLFPQWLSLILLCVYLLLANILLLNLLIAMFSNTFGEVEKQTDQIWKFQRFSLIKEYHKRPAAPPPFILFIHFYLLVKHGICKQPTQSNNMPMLELYEESSLLSWESYRRDIYQQMKQQRGEQSQENLAKDTEERVSAVLQLLRSERGDDRSQPEGRLSAMEEQMGRSSQELAGRLSTIEEQMGRSSQELKGSLSTMQEKINWIVLALKEDRISSRRPSLVHQSSYMESEEKATLGPEQSCLYHINPRLINYPDCDVTHFPVPGQRVPGEVEFPGCEPRLNNRYQKDRGSKDPAAEDYNMAKAVDGRPSPSALPRPSTSSSPMASQMIAQSSPRGVTSGDVGPVRRRRFYTEEGEEASPLIGDPPLCQCGNGIAGESCCCHQMQNSQQVLETQSCVIDCGEFADSSADLIAE